MDKRVIYLQYTNPAAYPPLQHSSCLLADEGWEVLFLGKDSEGSELLRFPSHKRVTVRRLPSVLPGWRQKLHYIFFALWASLWALRWRPHWIYASDPTACPAALLLSYLPGVSVLYHEHDSPRPRDEVADESAVSRLLRHARRKLVHRAEECVLPNEQRIRHFVEETDADPARVHCVWNCPSRDEAVDTNEKQGDDKIRVLYHGSLNETRLPFSVLEALSKLPDFVHLRVIGYETIGNRGYRDGLKERARRLDIAHRVDMMKPVAHRHKLLEHARRCHIGLSFMPMDGGDLNTRHMAGASNKPFDYLACGLPVVISDLPSWKRMYVEPGFGCACDPDDPTEIAETIRSLIRDREMLAEMGQKGRERIRNEWNYETEFETVRKRMRSRIQ